MPGESTASHRAAAPCVVTGSSGFIGRHLCARLEDDGLSFSGVDRLEPSAPGGYAYTQADIRDAARLRGLADPPPETVIHLAAEAEVEVPFGELSELMSTNVIGTACVLEILRPRRMLFTSSSAVYGDGGPAPVPVGEESPRPLGAYGLSKLAAEWACGQWARERGGAALSFRLGNVVGPACRGLIPYLVRHARCHPDGAVPARIRGHGRLVRDYVPVGHTVAVLAAALRSPIDARSWQCLNLGTGVGRTNGEVAEQVCSALERRGLVLRIVADAPILLGEAHEIVLDPGETFRRFGVSPPAEPDVTRAIDDAVAHELDSAGGAGT